MTGENTDSSGVTRRDALGLVAAAAAGSLAGCGSAIPFGGTGGTDAASGSAGVIYPMGTDIEGPCEAGGGEHPATGAGAANWFHIGDCGSWKRYAVDPDRTYRIVAYADDCALDQAAFAIEEPAGDDWRTVREVGPTDISTSSSDSVDDRLFGDATDVGIRLRTEPTHELLYSPGSSRIRLRSLGDLCNPGGYVTVYEYPLVARSTSDSIGPEAYMTRNVPGVTLRRNRDLPPDHDRHVDVPGNEYRFEYEGAGSQSVVLHKRDETENHPYVLYWFELSSQFVTGRTDSPPESVDEWQDGDRSYQLVPATEEQLGDADGDVDADLEALRAAEPPMTLPTETIATVGYEVTTTGGLSVAGTAERLAVNEPKPGVAYSGLVETDPGSASRDVVADLIDVWDPTPDVPTSSGEFAVSALRDEEFVGRTGTRLFGEFVGELGRSAAKPLDWTISFYETIGALSPDCSGDYAEQDERSSDRKLNVVVCDRGVASQNAIVQVAHKKGDSGTVEFTSKFGLNHGTSGARPADSSVSTDELAFDGEVTFTHSVELPLQGSTERDRRACESVPECIPPDPEMAFDPEPPFETGVTVTMTGSATVDPELSVESYEWVVRPPEVSGVEAGEAVRLSGETVEYGFEAAGTYEVELRVTDEAAQTGAVRTEVTVERGEAPDGYVRFSGAIEGASGEPVTTGIVEFTPVVREQRGGADLRFEVDEAGEFVADVPEGRGYRVAFTQEPRFPTDGVPDFYTLGTVSADESRELPAVSLPEPHPVSVSVVDESGDPMTGGRVSVGHFVKTPGNEDPEDDLYDEAVPGYDDAVDWGRSVPRFGSGPGGASIGLDGSGGLTFRAPGGSRDSLEFAGSIEVSYESPDGEWWRGVTTRVDGPTTVEIAVGEDEPGWEER